MPTAYRRHCPIALIAPGVRIGTVQGSVDQSDEHPQRRVRNLPQCVNFRAQYIQREAE